ncbi:hypothetical protein APICC_01503 [Apis cerana cerana]|uniref:Uncharacterized protein n=1 Tax=Apis cerana cerana TaxID=94128 RepID=A0A2A3EB57_APICC|nr:hypothetical protein APICC_01503 [Apis cerana cerana]
MRSVVKAECPWCMFSRGGGLQQRVTQAATQAAANAAVNELMDAFKINESISWKVYQNPTNVIKANTPNEILITEKKNVLRHRM